MIKTKRILIWVGLLFFGIVTSFNYVTADISIARPAPCLTDLDELTDIRGPSVITVMSADLGIPISVYYFQWGNNYGFIPNPATTLIKSIWRESYNNSNYSSPTFVKITTTIPYDYWYGGSHDGVWGGANDGPSNNWAAIVSNVVGRKGPCPVGYHVPSAGEWGLLVRYWRDTFALNVPLYGNNGLYFFKDSVARGDFMGYFNLSFWGDFFYSDALLHNKGEVGYYWSSSPSGPSSNYARRLTLTPAGVYSTDTYYRARGFTIRCFKNP